MPSKGDGEPYEMDVTKQPFLYLAARVYVVHVSVDHNLEQYFWIVWTAAALTVQFLEVFKIQTVDNGIDNTRGIVFRDILIDSLRKNTIWLGV